MNDHVYSRLEYQDVVSGKKNILETEQSFLNILNNINNYKALRKKEIVLKIKLRNDLKHIKDSFTKISNHVPQTKGIKHIKAMPKKREKEVKRNSSIDEQLMDIKKRLSELN